MIETLCEGRKLECLFRDLGLTVFGLKDVDGVGYSLLESLGRYALEYTETWFNG